MPLGDPNQGQQQWDLINQLLRKQEEEDAQSGKLNLAEILEVSRETEEQNALELQRREAERNRWRSDGRLSSLEDREQENNDLANKAIQSSNLRI
tara:strand:- start:758 stop:1042 length:285 start_codon:yes stop_codon:yes gene_type:complete